VSGVTSPGVPGFVCPILPLSILILMSMDGELKDSSLWKRSGLNCSMRCWSWNGHMV